MTHWIRFRNCHLFHLFLSFYFYLSFQTGDSSINKDADTEQIRQAEIFVYQWIETWHGDNDTGSSLGSSLRIGGSNDDAY